MLSWFGVELPATFTGFGGMLIDGLVNGLGGAMSMLIEKVRELGSSVAETVKSALGINSPSRVFMDIGGYIMQGLTLGLSAAGSGPLAAVRQIGGTLAAAGALAMNSTQPALTAQAPGAAAIMINIYAAPGMDEKAVAELVARKIQDFQFTAAARERSRLTDVD